MRLIRVAICMSIKKLSKSNWVLTVCHVWTFLIGSTRVSATEGHVGLPERKSCSFFSQNLVISFITRGDITWQESSQCVTEQCRSVRPSVTCVSSVLAFVHARSHSSKTTTSHLFYNQQFGATIRLSATTRRTIPTLYLGTFQAYIGSTNAVGSELLACNPTNSDTNRQDKEQVLDHDLFESVTKGDIDLDEIMLSAAHARKSKGVDAAHLSKI
jgi:hypothetical protein